MRNAKDRYEMEEDSSNTEGYQATQENISDSYQPSIEKSISFMKGPEENSETGGSASTNETDFKRLELLIEEVILVHKDSTPRFRDTASLFTTRLLEHLLPERFRFPNIRTYDGKTDP